MTPCIEWRGPQAGKGYGAVYYHGRMTYAHRMVWEETHGPIPPGMLVHHECHIRLCYNVEHLHLMTVAEHRRHHGSTRTARATCKNGHPFDKVTERQRVCSICAREHGRINMRRARALRRVVTATPV